MVCNSWHRLWVSLLLLSLQLACVPKDGCRTDDDCLSGRVCGADGRCQDACPDKPIHDDNCCIDPGIMAPHEDSDCPQLELYFSCRENSDCESGLCQAYESLQGDSICSVTCEHTHRVPLVGGDCPEVEVGSLSICLSRSHSEQQGSRTCLPLSLDAYLASDPDLGVIWDGFTTRGEIGQSDDMDLFFLQFESQTQHRANIDLEVTAESGLEVAVHLFDAAMVHQDSCGQTGYCYHYVDVGERVYFLVAGLRQTTGEYALRPEVIPF